MGGSQSKVYRKMDQNNILVSLTEENNGVEILFTEKHLKAIRLSEKFKKIIDETFAAAVVLTDIIKCLRAYKGKPIQSDNSFEEKWTGFAPEEIYPKICEDLICLGVNINYVYAETTYGRKKIAVEFSHVDGVQTISLPEIETKLEGMMHGLKLVEIT